MADFLSRLLNPNPIMNQSGGASPMPFPQMQPQEMQRPGFGQNFRSNLGPILQALGMGIASNDLGRGAAMIPGLVDNRQQRQMQIQEQQEEQQRKNQTVAFFRSPQGDPQIASMLEQGVIDGKTAVSMWQQKQQTAQQGDEWSMNPVYGTDPETGETVLGVTSRSGKFKKLDTGGVKISSGVDKIDVGTHYVLQDKRSGQPIGTIPKENYQEAYDKAEGAKVGGAMGEDKALLASTQSKMPGLMQTVSELDKLSETASYTWAQRARDEAVKQAGGQPSESAIARTEYIAKVDNVVLPMLRDTFGAAFTVAEGESLRATLGDPNKSPKEKQAVLRAFITQKQRNIEAMAARTGQPAPAPLPAPQKPISEMSDAELEAIANGEQ